MFHVEHTGLIVPVKGVAEYVLKTSRQIAHAAWWGSGIAALIWTRLFQVFHVEQPEAILLSRRPRQASCS